MKLLLNDKEAAEMLGIGRSTLHALVKRGKVPAPIHLDTRITRWVKADLQQHIEAKKEVTQPRQYWRRGGRTMKNTPRAEAQGEAAARQPQENRRSATWAP